MFTLWKNSDGILVNTVEEIDNIGLMYYCRKLGRPVWAVGPVLLSTESKARAGKEFGISAEECRSWLQQNLANQSFMCHLDRRIL